MKRLAIACTAVALLAAPVAYAQEQNLTAGEVKLAKLLEGRTAGEPVNCLPLGSDDTVQIIDKTALVYGHGNTLWVNKPTNASSLDRDDILVRKSHTAQVCNLDTIQLMDRTSKFYSGFVGLNQFVPYRKAEAAE